MTKIAVIGGGYWGSNLIRVFFQLNSLSTICDKNPETLKKYHTQYPDVRKTINPEEIFKDKSIDGVVIATPPATHFQLAKDVLLNHKHVFVEKPLALSVNEGKELISISENNKKILMVGHLLQYHSAVLELKKLIDSNELGKIQYIYSNRLNIGKIRTEENILWSFAPHDISVILMLLNEFPETIYATGGNYLQIKITDVTLTTMDFASGVKSHIFVSWLHPFKEQKLVIIGDKKMAVFDDMSEEKLFLYPHKIEWIDRIPIASKAKAEVVPFKMEEPLKAECSHFIECIEKGLKPKTDGHEALRVLRVLESCQESLNNPRPLISSTDSYSVHKSSYVDENVLIGENTKIWHFCHILKNSKIGRNCHIGQNVVIGPEATVGDNCKIQNNVSIYKGVTLEDEVFCGPSMVFTNVLNPRSAIPRMKELKQTLVKKGATIGANATIVCGNTIGRYAFVGAGAVVTADVADYALVAGVPARRIGWMCECGEKLKSPGKTSVCPQDYLICPQDYLICPSCKKKYKKTKTGNIERNQ